MISTNGELFFLGPPCPTSSSSSSSLTSLGMFDTNTNTNDSERDKQHQHLWTTCSGLLDRDPRKKQKKRDKNEKEEKEEKEEKKEKEAFKVLLKGGVVDGTAFSYGAVYESMCATQDFVGGVYKTNENTSAQGPLDLDSHSIVVGKAKAKARAEYIATNTATATATNSIQAVISGPGPILGLGALAAKLPRAPVQETKEGTTTGTKNGNGFIHVTAGTSLSDALYVPHSDSVSSVSSVSTGIDPSVMLARVKEYVIT